MIAFVYQGSVSCGLDSKMTVNFGIRNTNKPIRIANVTVNMMIG